MISGFSDASFATGSKGKSVDGYIVYVNGMPVCFRSGQQSTVALSTTESEYVAAVGCAKKMICIKNLMKELDFKVTQTRLFCDNLGAVYISEGTNATKIKHIEVKLFWLRDKIEEKELQMSFVKSEKNVADIFTKPLVVNKFMNLRKYIMANV